MLLRDFLKLILGFRAVKLVCFSCNKKVPEGVFELDYSIIGTQGEFIEDFGKRYAFLLDYKVCGVASSKFEVLTLYLMKG